jgi:PAS domain S-box-containing protein
VIKIALIDDIKLINMKISTKEAKEKIIEAYGDIHRRRSSDFVGISDANLHRLIIEKAQDLIGIIDSEGQILFASPSCQRVLGLKHKDIVGHKLTSFIHPDDTEQASRITNAKKSTASTAPITIRIKHKDGHYVYLEGNSTSFSNPKNQEPLFLAVFRDISDKKSAEDQLRLYKEIVFASQDGIGITDSKGCYLEQNRAHQDLLGYTDEELAGKTPAIHLGRKAFEGVVAALQANGVFRGEVKSRSKDGRDLDIELSAFAVKDEAGKTACFVGIKRDISERKSSEQRLRDANKRITSLLEGLLGPSG